MPFSMSDYLEKQLASHIWGNGNFTKPTGLFIALTNRPLQDYEDKDLSQLEVSNAGGYARVISIPTGTTWTEPVGTGSIVRNLIALTFPDATADWGMVSGMAIVDNVTWGTGNVLVKGSLTTPRDIRSGDTFRFKISDISIILD